MLYVNDVLFNQHWLGEIWYIVYIFFSGESNPSISSSEDSDNNSLQMGVFDTQILPLDLYTYPSPLANIDFSALTQSAWRPTGKYLPKRTNTDKQESTLPTSRGRRGSVVSTKSIKSTRSNRSLKSLKSVRSVQADTSLILSEAPSESKRPRTSKKSGKVVKPGKSTKTKKGRHKSTTSKVSKASKASRTSPDIKFK